MGLPGPSSTPQRWSRRSGEMSPTLSRWAFGAQGGTPRPDQLWLSGTLWLASAPCHWVHGHLGFKPQNGPYLGAPWDHVGAQPLGRGCGNASRGSSPWCLHFLPHSVLLTPPLGPCTLPRAPLKVLIAIPITASLPLSLEDVIVVS